MRAPWHRGTMTWQSFDVTFADQRTTLGFVLIGRVVRARRQRLGLTQRQLELLSGVDQSVISRLENGLLGGLRWSRFARLVGAIGGLGETDPAPPWSNRFLPPGRGPDDAPGLAHQVRAVATIVERLDRA